MNCGECSFFYIHFENLSVFTKEHLFRLSPRFEINEEIFHADSLKEWNFFDHDSINLLKSVFICFQIRMDFKQKQLVLCLNIHH